MLVQLAGLSFRPKSAKDLVKTLVAGAKFTLQPEPDNEHDPYAIQVHFEDEFIGYIPRTASEEISTYINSGCTMQCELVEPDDKKPILNVTWTKPDAPAA